MFRTGQLTNVTKTPRNAIHEIVNAGLANILVAKSLGCSFSWSLAINVRSRLTINIQQAVRILKRWNEYRESTGTAYGSDSAETSCARHGAELLRLAPAILRQSHRASGSFIE